MGGNGARSRTVKNGGGGLGLNPTSGGGTVKAKTIGNLSDFVTTDQVYKTVAGLETEKKRVTETFKKKYANIPVIAKLPKGVIASETSRFFTDKDNNQYFVYRTGSMFDSNTKMFAVRVTKAQQKKRFQDRLKQLGIYK